MANISNFTALSKRVGTNKNLIDNPLTPTEQGIINRANTPAKPVTPTPAAPSPIWNISDASGTRPMGTPAAAGTTSLFPDAPNPIQQKLDQAVQQPQSITDVVNQTYDANNPIAPGGSQNYTPDQLLQMQYTDLQNTGKKYGLNTPGSVQDVLAQNAQRNKEDIAALDAQQQNQLAQLNNQNAQSYRQMDAAQAGITATLAQGREGVQSSSAPLAIQQYNQVLGEQKQMLQLKSQQFTQQIAAQTLALKRAQEDGDTKLASNIQNQIQLLEKQQSDHNLEVKKAAADDAKLAMDVAKFNIDTGIAKTNSLIDQFKVIGSGLADMSDDAIIAMTTGTNVTAGAALAYKAGAKLIADADKIKDLDKHNEMVLQGKKLQSEIDNANKTPQVLTYEYYSQLSQEGQSKFKEVLAMDKGSQLVKLDDGSLVIYNPTTSTMQRVPAGSTAISNMQNTDIQNVFTLEGTSKYRTDGGWECGEGANKITEGGKAGDTYASKLSLVTKQDSPQIGNQIVLPIGSPNNGHIGTVISYDPTTRNVKTVEWNHNLDGRQTVESYNIDDLNKRYPPKGGKVQWGFSDSTLKPQYEEALNNAAVPPNDIEGMKIRAIVNGLGGTAGERNENMKNMKALVASGKAANAAEAKAQLGLITPADKERQTTMKAELQVEQKAINEIMGQLAPAEQLLKTGTGMSDYTAIVGFLKGIDPGSVARESEVQSVQQAQGVLSNVFERLQNKSLTGEKLTQQQRDEMLQAINIIKTARAEKYYEDLISRKLETEEIYGTPATFASKSEIAKYESWVGKEKAAQIKKEVSERLGLTSSTYKLPGSPDTTPLGYTSPK